MRRSTLVVVMFVLVAIPVAFWASTLTWRPAWQLYTYDAARLLALVGFVLILCQYVLSSRIKWIERGIGLDRLFILHRMSGIIGVVLVLLHPPALSLPGLLQGYGTFLSFPEVELREVFLPVGASAYRVILPMVTIVDPKLSGVLALVLVCTTAGAALLYRTLRWRYETWKAIHRVSYTVLPVALGHSLLLGSDLSSGPLRVFWLLLGGVYATVMIHRISNWAYVRRHPFVVAKVVQETHDTWSLHFRGRLLKYNPGQFMIVQLIRNGKISEPHPFTISSPPTRDGLSITVKSVGDFTSTIGDTKTSDRACVDAPYGVFTFLRHDTEDLVFISGGIGITPFLSMLRYMYDLGLEKRVTLLSGNKSEEDIPCREELANMAEEMASLKVVHVMSKQSDWPGEKGYIDAEILQRHVSDLENSHFFICGPPIMMTTVLKELRELHVGSDRIHYERFALR